MTLGTERRRQTSLDWLRLPAGALLAGVVACSGLTDDGELPPDVPDPGSVETPAGALEAYRGGLKQFQAGLREALDFGGLLTDELTLLGVPLGIADGTTPVDTRHLPSGSTLSDGVYAGLQTARGQAQEARGLLADFAPDLSPALIGHLYALEAYAEIYLADLFCSGIPLSTVDYDGDYTLAPGSSTEEVYEHALGLFDAALPLAGDSASIVHLASVGRGRSLLALGRYAEAAAAVATVPDNYRYEFVVTSGTGMELWQAVEDFNRGRPVVRTVPEASEGLNGLDYRSSADPRTLTEAIGQNQYGSTMYLPSKYLPVGGPVSVIIASGAEARLIEAEVGLAAGGDDWLARLNALRTTGTFDTQPNAVDSTRTDTLWHAGSGGVAGLRPLEDPEAHDAQVGLLFRERAFWLYLTGHRQGDLRRMIRQYQRAQQSVYPTGTNYPGATGIYGSDVTSPVPEAERTLNPLFTGCINRNA